MIELHRIRADKEAVVRCLNKRGVLDAAESIEAIATLDRVKREVQAQLEPLASRLNKLNKEIGHELDQQQYSALLQSKKEEIALLKAATKGLMQKRKACESALLEKLYQLPNLPHNSVPPGMRVEDNQIVYESNPLPHATSGDLAHWDLIKQYGLIDFELGNKVTGSGFPIYIGKGAKLQRALINFFLDKALEAGYVEVQPSILVNEASACATGQLPDKEGQMYHIASEDLYLIPTAEVPITNIYRDCILNSLPIKHVGYTPCFRREAGSWGAHVRGLNRLHQFDKVELVQICHPEHSYINLEEMLVYVRGLVEQLTLPYRIVKLCAGDLGFCSAMTYDIEVYSKAQKRWLEVSSVSNFETFQSNRLALRYKDSNKQKCFVHTLNGSALALPRIVAALLELYQTPTGISIPEVLQPYTGFAKIS